MFTGFQVNKLHLVFCNQCGLHYSRVIFFYHVYRFPVKVNYSKLGLDRRGRPTLPRSNG